MVKMLDCLLLTQATEKGILNKGGGHHKACGFTLKKENVAVFKNFLIEETNNRETDHFQYSRCISDGVCR